MQPDYCRFGSIRQIFPRKHHFASTRLICGHINRLKFPPNIQHYLDDRKQGINRRTALARARTCKCYRQTGQQNQNQLVIIQTEFPLRSKMIRQMHQMDFKRKD